MDLISVLSITSTVIDLLQLSSSVASYPVGSVSDLIALLRLYGISGYFVWAYGSQSVWRMQAKLLGSFNDNDAMAFRKSMQDECTMTAVAVCLSQRFYLAARLIFEGCHRSTNRYHRAVFAFSLPGPLGRPR